MRVGAWCSGVLLVVLGCATNSDQPHRRPVVSVVSQWGAVGEVSSDLTSRMADVIDTEEVVLNIVCVDEREQIPRLLSALVERGDSIIVGLGRPLVSHLRSAAERNHGTVFFWLGWGPKPPNVSSPVHMWWVEADSLQESVAALAAGHVSQGRITVVGNAISPRVLSCLQTSGIVVEQYAVDQSTPREGNERQRGQPRRVLVLEQPEQWQWHESHDHVYWAAEAPPDREDPVRAELRTDWPAALRNALQWHFHRKGTPPGGAADRWLDLKLNESGGSSP